MKISCIQMDVRLREPERNFQNAQTLVRRAAAEGADVAVLPETFNTGFFPKENLAALADQDGQKTKEIFGGLARELQMNIVAGSVANRKADGVYNTCYVFDRSGAVVGEYDKTHLFSPMQENVFFLRGGKGCIFTLDGVRCGVVLCYDIRFPEFIRNYALQGLDVLFVAAEWPLVRLKHLKTLVKARAIENQIFAACANGCGGAGDTVFGGCSRIVDPWGEVLADASYTESILTAECDLNALSVIRNSIHVYNDRRPELYLQDVWQ